MAKQIMQDVVAKKNKEEVSAGGLAKETTKSPAPLPSIEDSLEVPSERSDFGSKIEDNGGPSFAPIDSSPIFEKMKRHNNARESFSDEFSNDRRYGGKKLFWKISLIVVAAGFLGAFLYGIFFYDAVVVVTPKSVDMSLLGQEFLTGGNASSTIPLHLMTLSEEESADLAATGEEKVSTKSSGKIIIYNDFSTKNQRLVKNTRFQTPDGKIYRIAESIDVPGQKTVDGKTVPGSLEVTVYADVPGDEYNIDLSDFTIPGFKGSPRYEKFYARSKTPMSGGFVGIRKVVSGDDIQKARETLTGALKEKLLSKAIAQKPKDTVLYKEGVFYSFTDSTDNGVPGSDGKTVKFTLKGDITALFFDAAELSAAIIGRSVPPADISAGELVLVTNAEELTFSLKSTSTAVPKEGDVVSFSLSGNAHAVWQIDTSLLLGKLAGAKKAEYKNAFIGFSGVEKANAEIHPFWKTRFPSDISKIRINIISDKP